jgi:hypothetical protein
MKIFAVQEETPARAKLQIGDKIVLTGKYSILVLI